MRERWSAQELRQRMQGLRVHHRATFEPLTWCVPCTMHAMGKPQRRPRVLIVYYSRSGATESVARGLARASDAELEALVATTNRRGVAGYALSSFEAFSGREGRIQTPRHNPGDYEIVLVGTPTWSASVSSPIRTYLNRYAVLLPAVGFFVTCGARGSERVLEQMQRISGKKPLAKLALCERDLERHASVYLGEFWEKTLSAWETQSAIKPPPHPLERHDGTLIACSEESCCAAKS
jgi:hypothetical protein